MDPKKILIIDDDEDFRFQNRTFLESHNYSVIEAISAKDGLAKLAEEKPDLIILDIMMETDQDGYAVIELVKYNEQYEEYHRIPIIMVSSIQDDPETRYPHSDRYADLITPDQYLTKPIDFDKLLESVEILLEK